MVWQETNDVAVIIMLTQTHDGTLEKCFQYFPLNSEAGSYKLDPIDRAAGTPEGSVTFSGITSDPGSKTEVRKLSLKFGEDTKDVWHFMFTGWPDFAVPEDQDRAALLDLLKLSAEKNSTASNPRIIHCSAGVGRSGTFIALEYLLAQVDSGAIADNKDGADIVYDVVNQLREQRMTMVQMDIQFQFLYDVVKEQYKQKQGALQPSGQNSPKLQDIASGLRAALIDEARIEDEFSHQRRTAEGHDEGAERIEVPIVQPVGAGEAGHDP
jgi:protein-tyrosine phosphatase